MNGPRRVRLPEHIVEIVGDAGEGTQNAAIAFAQLRAKAGNGLWTVEIIAQCLDGKSGAALRKMMSLLETGMPIKILALRSSLREVYSVVAATRVPATLSVEMLLS